MAIRYTRGDNLPYDVPDEGEPTGARGASDGREGGLPAIGERAVPPRGRTRVAEADRGTVSDADVAAALRAAGIKAPAATPDKPAAAPAAAPAVSSDAPKDTQDALSAAGVEWNTGAARKPPLDPTMVPPAEGTPTKLGPTGEQMAEGLAGEMSAVSPVAEGIPVIGAAPRIAAAATGAAGVGTSMSGKTFEERFKANEGVLKRASDIYTEKNPVWSTAGNALGSLLAVGPLAASKYGRMAMGVEGPTLGSRLYTGTAGGTGIAAADAAARGEKMAPAAIIGAAGGALGPLTGSVARGGARLGSEYMWPRQGPLRDVDPVNVSRLVSSMEGETPASLAEARRRMGPAGFFGDLNTATTDIAGGVADTPGPGKGHVREAYRQRGREQRQRVDQALTQAMGPDSDIEAFKKFTTEARKAASDPLYEQWRTMQIHPTDKLKELIPRLEKAKAFDMAEELSSITGEPINKAYFTTGREKSFPTAQSWDYVKRGLDRRIDQAYSGGDKTLARALIDLKRDMLAEIEKTPQGLVWKQARQEFASRSAILDQIEAGRDTFLGSRAGLSKDELKHELESLTGPELAARVQGARSAAAEAMGETARGDTTLRNKILAPNNQEKLRYLLGKKKADDLIQTMEQEAHLSNQGQNIVGGTQTAPKNKRIEALEAPPAHEWDINLAQPTAMIPRGMRPSHIFEAWRQQRYGRAANQLAPIVTTREGPQLDDLVRAIYAEGQRRALVEAAGRGGSHALTSIVSQPVPTAARRRYERP